MKSDGTFFGMMYDSFGSTEVVGRISETGISWTKTYQEEANPNTPKYSLTYNFKGAGYGWIGEIVFDQKDKPDPNSVYCTSCVMLPYDNLKW